MAKKRTSWLARKFGIKKTFSVQALNPAVAALASNASAYAFLDVAEFQQSSEPIGEGEYTLIFALKSVVLEDLSNDDELSQRRKELKENVLTNGPEKYAIKRLNKKYFKDKETLKRAATKLVNEANILSMLHGSPHILSIRALNRDVLESCGDGLEDFFILTDRVTDTLARRINRWRQESADKGEAPNDDRIPMKSNYAFQMAKAVKACHDQGIMVRTKNLTKRSTSPLF